MAAGSTPLNPDLGGQPPCQMEEFGFSDLANRHDVEQLVRTFYRAAAMDDLLGPIFEAEVADWNQHIATITDFWMWQMFGERGYDRAGAGQPLVAHRAIHEHTPLGAAHFARWESLWVETLAELFCGPIADATAQRGTKMVRAMRRLIEGTSAAGDEPVAVTVAGGPPRRSA